jgi:enamine deaminase RidA (YjgF/YER057c/UK114 family)
MPPTDPSSAGSRPADRPLDADSLVVIHPPLWPQPKGYAYGIIAQGRTVFLSGIIGWTAQHRLVAPDFLAQARQALSNIVELLREAGAGPDHIVRMTWYVVDKREYASVQRELGAIYRDVIGRHFPSMTVVEVAGLLEEGARVEIETTAVVPV